jgi:hypothetical protein
MTKRRKPKNTRFGTDFAGVVEAVGKNVTDFKPGDEVFGARNGAVSDYVCVKTERAVVMIEGFGQELPEPETQAGQSSLSAIAWRRRARRSDERPSPPWRATP